MKWPPHKRKRNGKLDGRRYCRFCKRRRRQWRGWQPRRKRWARVPLLGSFSAPICYVCVARIEAQLGAPWNRSTAEAIKAAFQRIFIEPKIACNARPPPSGMEAEVSMKPTEDDIATIAYLYVDHRKATGRDTPETIKKLAAKTAPSAEALKRAQNNGWIACLGRGQYAPTLKGEDALRAILRECGADPAPYSLCSCYAPCGTLQRP